MFKKIFQAAIHLLGFMAIATASLYSVLLFETWSTGASFPVQSTGHAVFAVISSAFAAAVAFAPRAHLWFFARREALWEELIFRAFRLLLFVVVNIRFRRGFETVDWGYPSAMAGSNGALTMLLAVYFVATVLPGYYARMASAARSELGDANGSGDRPETPRTVFLSNEARPTVFGRIIDASFWAKAPRSAYMALLAITVAHWFLGYYAISPSWFIPSAESLSLNDIVFPYLATLMSGVFVVAYLGLLATVPNSARKLKSSWNLATIVLLAAVTIWMSSISVSRGVLAGLSHLETGALGTMIGRVTGRDLEAGSVNDCDYRARVEFDELPDGEWFYVCLADRAAYDAAADGGFVRLQGEIGRYGFRYETATLTK